MKDVLIAKKLLINNVTCVLINKDKQLISTNKGISPMIDYLDNNIDLKGYSVADKIVGKAAAFLFIFAGIKEVYAEVISNEGIEILKKYNIPFTYKTKTEVIINRKGDDICPMEKAVKNIDDPKKAYIVLKNKLILLR